MFLVPPSRPSTLRLLLLRLFLLLPILHNLVVILEHLLKSKVDNEEQQHVGERVPEVWLQVQLRFSTVVAQPLWKGEKYEECRDDEQGEKYEEGYPEVLDLLVRCEEEEVHEEDDYQECQSEPEDQVLQRFEKRKYDHYPEVTSYYHFHYLQ